MIMPTEHLRWRRAKRCGSNTCVEVATDGEHYLIRDSKRPEIEPLRFTGAGGRRSSPVPGRVTSISDEVGSR